MPECCAHTVNIKSACSPVNVFMCPLRNLSCLFKYLNNKTKNAVKMSLPKSWRDARRADVFLSLSHQPKLGLGCFTFEVSRSHTIKTHLLELRWTSDQPVAEAATYTKHSKHIRRTFMPSAVFELAIPANRPLQTCALDRTATAIGAQRHSSTHS